MEASEIRETLLEEIGKDPGTTKNKLYYGHFEKTIGKFPPMYAVLRELIKEGKVKIDGKKKNTGHYLADVDIPEGVPTSAPSHRRQTTNKSENYYHERRRKAKQRFVLEKNEGHKVEDWRLVDENDIQEPIDTLFEQCVRLVPLHYRVRDTKENKTLHERIPDYKNRPAEVG